MTDSGHGRPGLAPGMSISFALENLDETDTADRRGFLGGMLAAMAACVYGLPFASAAEKPSGPEENAVLDAVLDTLIPEDGYPGALQAGVPERVAELMAASPRRARLYRRGLAAVDRHARAHTGRPFRSLDPAQRRALLDDFRAGFGAGSIFFRYVRRDAMTTYYSSPAAYEMLSYEPPVNGYPYRIPPPDAADRDHG